MEPLDFSNLKASIWKLEFLHILKGFGLILPKIRPVALLWLEAHPNEGFFF